MRTVAWGTLLVLLALLLSGPAGAEDELYPKRAPWDGVHWRASAPSVRVAGAWYELVSLDGVTADEIVAFCKRTYASRWQKRFQEDLVEVLSRMKHPPGATVTLVLQSKAGERVTLAGVAMTEANRQAIRTGRSARPRDDDDDEDVPKLAPWNAVRWIESTPEVRLETTWYRLVSLEGLQAEAIVRFAKENHGRRWKRRFEEDLVEMLVALGKPVRRAVDLVLAPLEGGEPVTLTGVRMTKENRNAVWRAAVARDRAAALASRPQTAVRRVERKHAEMPDGRFRWLTKRYETGGEWGRQRLSAAQAAADLDELEWALENRFSYLHLRPVDYRAALDTIRLGLGDHIQRGAFALQIQKLVSLFGDGHARVRGLRSRLLTGPYLGLRLVGHRDLVLAVDGSRLPRGGPHRVIAMDGVPIEHWLEEAQRLVAAGSPQFRRRQAIRLLNQTPYLRAQLDVKAGPTVAVEITDVGGGNQRKVLVPLVREPLGEDASVRAVDVRPMDDVGYIRIAEMSSDPRAIATIQNALATFAPLKGLVIDVRGNGGGSRDILRALFPYVMKLGDAPHIANVAAYRLPPGEEKGLPEGYLQNRYMYPRTASVWREPHKKPLYELEQTFEPDWKLPADQFSAWHYMVLDRADAKDAFFYDKPIVILMDGGCFSATDIFLGAFSGWRDVTLVGTPSGGGSGRSRNYRLRNSEIDLRLSSMASFRPSGQRYDGKGIEPDVVVLPNLEDLRPGSTSDAQLDMALKFVRQ